MHLSSCRQSQNRRTGARNQPEIGLKLVLRRLFSRCARCRKFITRSSLDPMCRRDVLEVMERLRKHTAIFYSTHILEDVQRVSDTVAILKDGELIAEAPIDRLLAGSTTGLTYALELKGDVDGARARIVAQPWVSVVSAGARNGSTHLDVTVSDEAAADARLLSVVTAEPGVTVAEFGRRKHNLEEVFLSL